MLDERINESCLLSFLYWVLQTLYVSARSKNQNYSPCQQIKTIRRAGKKKEIVTGKTTGQVKI